MNYIGNTVTVSSNCRGQLPFSIEILNLEDFRGLESVFNT